MEEITSLPDPPKVDNSNNFWKSLLRTVLGISISIVLTFGTNALLMHHRTVKDRKMMAMMVIGNIETFAEHLEQCATHMSWNDTLAIYLLNIPEDSLDFIAPDSLLPFINNVTAYYTLTHDKSTESIFSNSIDTWKNLGNFEFIENVGQCFADIKSIEAIYEEFLNVPNRVRERMLKNLDVCPGNTLASKVLHDKEYRNHLVHIHSQGEYYQYLAAYIRWKNAKNMKLMNVKEEDLKRFIEERGKKQENTEPAPDQEQFRTPRINPDNLPEFKDWIK